ncbi:YdeI/OmpD-associated family protein [Cohnella cellulosilytica]|uniref:YdeI/OmpD-associated family protein n=1 Tax=Cohnella cellulosilytica TaxID=986710 RepID=A0ABW2FGA7_9BACL
MPDRGGTISKRGCIQVLNGRRSALYSNVEGAKSAETRQRRIDKSVESLREGKVQ